MARRTPLNAEDRIAAAACSLSFFSVCGGLVGLTTEEGMKKRRKVGVVCFSCQQILAGCMAIFLPKTTTQQRIVSTRHSDLQILFDPYVFFLQMCFY